MDSDKNNHEAQAHEFDQNVVVMRHGDRIDNFDPEWVTTAARPWDPPLIGAGRERAFGVGRKLRSGLGFKIHRVFASPFLRCVQTASEVVSALCALDDDPDAKSGHDIAIDPSKVKVCVEYGLCEMMNTSAIRPDVAPKDGNFGFNISELQAMLPDGTWDDTVKPVYKEPPEWQESSTDTRERYEQIIKELANRYPLENLLLVTHGEGVGVSVSAYSGAKTVYEVEYCAYAELRRHIVYEGQSFKAGDFEVFSQFGIGTIPGAP